MATIDYNAIRDELGEPLLTDTAIKTLLDAKGITSQAGAEKWAAANKAPDQAPGGLAGFFEKGAGAVSSLGAWEHYGSDVGNWLTDSLRGGGGKSAAKGKGKPAGPSAADKAAAEQKALQAQIQAVQNSPWTKLSNAVAQEYLAAEVPAVALASGAGIPAAQSSAAAAALGDLGLSPGSSAGQWLASQTAAADANTAPVSAAMKAEGAQMAAEAGPISKAIQAYGEANALSEMTAPESSWLSALAQHVQSNLSYYGQIPKASEGSLTPSVLNALKLSGGFGGQAGQGTVPIQNLTASATGGVRAKAPTGGGVGTVQTGVVPGATTNAG